MKFGWLEALALVVFSGLLLWCIPHHESWFDEAQAWLIARDSSLYDMVVHRLHYEGAPALWYVLLWIEVRLGVSFLGMHYITGLLAAAGAYVWLRYSPLPRILTLLVPFTYFLQYEYAVIARQYVLCPLFAFTLMALLQNRKSHPIWFCVVAGLMANCSAHMFAFAVGMVIWYWWDRRKDGGQSKAEFRRRNALPLAVFLLFLGVAAATAWPTSDVSNGHAIVNIMYSHHEHASSLDSQFSSLTKVKATATEQSHPNILWKGTQYLFRTPTLPISTSRTLAIVFLLLLVGNAKLQHAWISLLPGILVIGVFQVMHPAGHHIGMLWVAMLCTLWAISLKPITGNRAHMARVILYAITLVVVVLQAGWSAHCLEADVNSAYSPAPAAAQFLKTLPSAARIAIWNGRAAAVTAYMPDSPYFNLRTDYWPFSRTADPTLPTAKDCGKASCFVVVGYNGSAHQPSDRNSPAGQTESVTKGFAPYKLLRQRDFHPIREFCGEHFYRNASVFTDCLAIFQHTAATKLQPHGGMD